MGNYKYLLTLPFVALALTNRDDSDNWAFHMCGIAATRLHLLHSYTHRLIISILLNLHLD